MSLGKVSDAVNPDILQRLQLPLFTVGTLPLSGCYTRLVIPCPHA